MNRTVGARYLPLAALVAIQLLIVAVAPSTMRDQSVTTGSGGFDSSTGTPGGGTNGFTDPSTGVPVEDGSNPSGFADGGPTTPGVDVETPEGGAGPAGAQGDTSHCVGDRQFDPAIDFYAPPCVPESNGQNPGPTYQGVTGEKIKILQYVGSGDPAVEAIIKTQGTFVELEQYKAFNAAAATFINQTYELYGRKVEIETVKGTCGASPPDAACLQGEFRRLIQERKPFAVFWNVPACSACFAEMSKLKTVNLGGWHYRDEFSQRWRPYHYDVAMSGTRLAQHVGRFWCQQLAGHKAEYSRSYKDSTRQLGIISTNDPEHQRTVEIDLRAELATCGESYGNRKYFYKSDISTADQQRRAGVLAMRGNAVDPSDDATSVMCFCDYVAPAFLYQEEDTQQYYPENIVSGAGFMDTDAASQAYIGGVGCPQGDPCAFDGAFGLRSISRPTKQFTGAGFSVFKAGGGPGQTFEDANLQWDYLNLMASSMQMAGPNLSPETFEQGAFRLGARGDANHVLRQISPGSYGWAQDMMRVYWSSTKTSDYNGKRGTYVHLDPQRTRVDGWAKTKLVLPAEPR